ncbi:hypothetical protein AX16_001227 [Volvariella volvacea WC 439]|nr:hypothetical protein AX16_001227 [Volvariella volvacea WC 439]
MSPSNKSSSVVPGRYPPPGASPIADKIRARRGERGLTPLDGTLLHVPPVADGWNSLLGAVRTAGKLPGDVRELMILRVAAVNKAAFEWIHHEHVGRTHGLTTPQLYIVRDTTTPLPPSSGILNRLQIAALVFADQSTKNVTIEKDTRGELKSALQEWIESGSLGDVEGKDAVIDDLLVEAAAVVATYNMVSRFLVSLDVAGMSEDPVPWPVKRSERFISFPAHQIHAVSLITSPTAPWIVLANSLLTDLTMWDPLIPHLLNASYNILLHSQRGHGRSTLPSHAEDGERLVTIPGLADDLKELITQLIPASSLPVHSVMGVSQGGAVILSLISRYSHLTKSVVVCDTGPKTPAGNKQAWEERISLAFGNERRQGNETDLEYAKGVGMKKLADVTVSRWFAEGSPCHPFSATGGTAGNLKPHLSDWVHRMVSSTPVEGFMAGARALGEYDTLQEGLLENGNVKKVLLVAGELDGGGKVGKGLENLQKAWNEARSGNGLEGVEHILIKGSGHLPMIDCTEDFAKVVVDWLARP